MADKHDLRHVVSDAPRVMVVDGSKLVRKLIGDTLLKELPGARVVGCAGIEEARAILADDPYLTGGVWQLIRVDEFTPLLGDWA